MLGEKKKIKRISKPNFKTFIFGMYVVLKKTFRIISVMFIVICGLTVPSGCFCTYLGKKVGANLCLPYLAALAAQHHDSWIMMNNPNKHYGVLYSVQYSVHVPNSVHIQGEKTALCSGNSYNFSTKLHVTYIKCLLLFFIVQFNWMEHIEWNSFV